MRTSGLNVSNMSFQRYGLRINPFPYVGIPEDVPKVYSAREDEMRALGDAIGGVLEGSSSHVVIVGSYGIGKTKTMKVIKVSLERELCEAATVGYVSNPGESFLDLYRNLMQDIGEKKLRELIWLLLEKTSGNRGLRKKVANGEVLLTDLFQKARVALYEELGHTDFVNGLIQLVLDEHRFDAWKYLSGEPILSENRIILDVAAPIDRDERALRALTSFIKVLKITGTEIFCILIDELEAIQLLFPIRKQRLLNNIRRLIDLNPTGLSVVMACAPEAWSSLVREYHAFSERIFREVVLRPLDQVGTERLIASYLKEYRLASERRSALYPFTSDAINEISSISGGNVRRILHVCNRAISTGARSGFPQLSAGFLKQNLPEIFQSG